MDTIESLKAKAYDILVQCELHSLEIRKLQDLLKETNQKLAELQKPEAPKAE